MHPIRFGRSQHHFGVARQLDVARLQRAISQNDSTHFGRVIRRNGNLCYSVDVTVATNEGDAIAGKQYAIPLRFGSRWLMRRGPDMTGAQILDVAPLTIVVARAVVAPARYRQIAVATEPPAGVRDQGGIGNVAEYADHWLRSVGCL